MMMKAVVRDKYGSPDVLRLEEVEKPKPKDNEILVKVHASSVNAGDWHVMRGEPRLIRLMGLGLLKPKSRILGADIAGSVEAIGCNVTQFKPGDEVFGAKELGAFSQFVCVEEKKLTKKPANISFQQAAAIPVAALTALQALRVHGQLKCGERVLVVGASGGVGTFAVKLAKHFGADVTGVSSGANSALLRSIGADRTIDYTCENFIDDDKRYDLILDLAGDIPISKYRAILNPGGRWILIGGEKFSRFIKAIILSPLIYRMWGKKMKGMMARVTKVDLDFFRDIITNDNFTPVIDRVYPLAEIPEAIRYLETRRAKGKVIIQIHENA